MEDLEFIIVNSKLSHSQEKFYELQRRVSFGVYQETDEEEVWNLMEGGKDDMFIYDRCGRLTYFVPFPLSILNESPLVSNAILATYFRSPCGVTCDQNNTIDIEEFVNNLENDPENATVIQGNEDYVLREEFIGVNETSENQSSNNLLDVANSQSEFINQNSTDFENGTDYDYSQFNYAVNNNETNSTTVKEASSYFNVLYRLFFNTENDHKSEENFKSSITGNDNFANETDSQVIYTNTQASENLTTETNIHVDNNDTLHNDTIKSHHHNSHKHELQEPQKTKKSDRCVEADYSVCKSWSKKRLLHSQKCCSSGSKTSVDGHDHKSCHNFGKRRCKKIQSILKCCIKTLYTEDAVTTQISVEPTAANEVAGAVCCRTTDGGKLCRVSETGVCDEGEFVEDSPVGTI